MIQKNAKFKYQKVAFKVHTDIKSCTDWPYVKLKG